MSSVVLSAHAFELSVTGSETSVAFQFGFLLSNVYTSNRKMDGASELTQPKKPLRLLFTGGTPRSASIKPVTR